MKFWTVDTFHFNTIDKPKEGANFTDTVAAFRSREAAKAWCEKWNYTTAVQLLEFDTLAPGAPLTSYPSPSNPPGANPMPPIFEVAIIEQPSTNEKEAGAVDRILLPPTAVSALSESSAIVAASRLLKGDVPDASRLLVVVRPFKS